MASTAAKVAVTGGSTAAIGGAGAGMYLNQTSDNIGIPNIEEPETKKPIKSSSSKNPVNQKVKEPAPLKTSTNKPGNLGPDQSDTVLGRYWLYLLDTENPTNEYWWKQKYELWQKEPKTNLDTSFESVTLPYSSDNNKALNQICKQIYSQSDSSFVKHASKWIYITVPENFQVQQETKLTKNTWKFCSLLTERPFSTYEAKEYLAGDGDIINNHYYYAQYLAATKTNRNDDFWRIKEEWYEKIKKENDETQQKFVNYVKTRLSSSSIENKTLRELCESTYSESNQTDKEKIKLILKRCTFFDSNFDNWTLTLIH